MWSAGFLPGIRFLFSKFIRLAAYLVLQCPSPAFVLAVVGLCVGRRGTQTAPRPALLCLFVLNILAVLPLSLPDEYVFYQLSYVVIALGAGLGVEPTLAWTRRWSRTQAQRVWAVLVAAVLVLPVGVYALAPQVLPSLGVTSQRLGLREIPGRPALRYFLWPSLHDYRGAEEFARTVLNALPPDAGLIADYTVAQPLIYAQVVDGLRRDVQVAVVAEEEQVAYALGESAQRSVFLAMTEPYYDTEGLAKHFRIVQEGTAFRLLAK